MPPFVRAAALFVATAATAATCAAAPQDRIDAAIAKGTAALKQRFKDGAGPIAENAGGHGIGPAALAGIALLESNVPAADPAIKAIAASVRQQAYRESQTYQISLCLLFLDRLEDPADVPLIQILGARLLVGQTSRGGWTYGCVGPVPAADEQRLRTGLKVAELVAGKDGAPAKLHPMVQEYLTALVNARGPAKAEGGDNSNTQFGVLATWVSRKHGLPVEGALDLIERRFLGTQGPDGSWTYGLDTVGVAGSPQMTCAGLLGMATAIGRREERRAKTDAPKVVEPAAKTNDPFFNPPPRPDGKGPAGPKRPADARDTAAGRGFGFLGAALRAGGPSLQNLYLLWSLERVGVLYGADRIGGVDWYAGGSDYLVAVQAADGTWAGEYGADVDTSFAVLFLCKANLARDLSRRVRGDPAGSELRAGAANATPEVAPMTKGPAVAVNPLPVPVAAPLPAGAAGKVATDLIGANGPGLAKALAAARDAKGGDYTTGLAAAVHRLDGDAKKAAREALADRLARMSAATLKGLMTSSDPEVRRGAVLAAAVRDDKEHVPDLIERVNDEDDRVVRAARAGLRSLTGVDHGPPTDANPGARSQAQAAWRTWWAGQKR